MASTEQIVYEEAVRGLDKQEAALDDLRSRTGILLGAASLTTAFLGGQALNHRNDLVKRHLAAGAFDVPAWTAVGAFVGVAVFCLVILLPWIWNFVVSAQVLIEDHVEVPERNAPERLWLFLARTHEENWESNQPKLNRLFWAFRLAILSLAAEVVAWIFVLAN